jgi:hypothetical protein
VFFSNAGVATGADPLTTPIDVWNDQWQINVMSHIYAVRAVLPGMLERGHGYLLHTASMAGLLTSPGNLPYAVTKHAVVGLAEWLSITYHNKGIRVSLLAPLGVRTPMLGPTDSAFARTFAGPIKEPAEVAEMVVEAIDAERFLILTDPIAQKWMNNKTADLERWLHGVRRLQRMMDEPAVQRLTPLFPMPAFGRAVGEVVRRLWFAGCRSIAVGERRGSVQAPCHARSAKRRYRPAPVRSERAPLRLRRARLLRARSQRRTSRPHQA